MRFSQYTTFSSWKPFMQCWWGCSVQGSPAHRCDVCGSLNASWSIRWTYRVRIWQWWQVHGKPNMPWMLDVAANLCMEYIHLCFDWEITRVWNFCTLNHLPAYEGLIFLKSPPKWVCGSHLEVALLPPAQSRAVIQLISALMGMKSLLILSVWMQRKFSLVEREQERWARAHRFRLLLLGGMWAELVLGRHRNLLELAGALEMEIFYPALCNAAACPEMSPLQFSGPQGIIFCLKSWP